jgi:hypothetical protein
MQGQQLDAIEVETAVAVETQYQDAAPAKTWRNVVKRGVGWGGVPVSGRYAFGQGDALEAMGSEGVLLTASEAGVVQVGAAKLKEAGVVRFAGGKGSAAGIGEQRRRNGR